MAGDWIPMRTDLAEDPAVIVIAESLGLDEYAVVGRLHRLWSWANRQLTDGNALGVTIPWIDRYLSTPGFAAAILNAGWLLSRSGGVEFPNFNRWNSQSAKQRVLTARRVSKHKAGGNANGNGIGNAASVTNALPREEKRREEKKTDRPPTPEKGGNTVGRSEESRFDPLKHDADAKKLFIERWKAAGLRSPKWLSGSNQGLLLSLLGVPHWADNYPAAVDKAGKIAFLRDGIGRKNGPYDVSTFLSDEDEVRKILDGFYDPKAPGKPIVPELTPEEQRRKGFLSLVSGGNMDKAEAEKMYGGPLDVKPG